jgi:hypothetical protein
LARRARLVVEERARHQSEAHEEELTWMKLLPARHVSHGAQCDQVASALVSSASRSCCTGVPSPARTTYEGGVCPEATGAEVTPPDEAALDERKRRRASSARASAMMDSSGDGDGGCTLWYTERSAAEAAVAATRKRRMVVVAAMSRELMKLGSVGVE